MTDLQHYAETPEAVEEFKALMAEPAARQAFIEMRQAKRAEGAHLRYEHVLRAVGETPWAITPGMLGIIVDVLAFRVAGGRFSAEEIDQRIGAARGRPTAQAPSGVAVIPLNGVLIPKASAFDEISGGTSVDSFRSMFRDAMASREVSSIVMDIDSPGGMADQIPEMAAEIRAARGQKPITAVANTLAASGAYWLASQADEIVVTKSGRVGSIGVISAHEDESKRSELRGVKTTLVSAGRFKAEGNPFEPLTDEARAFLQSQVDEFYTMFVSDVARGRKVAVDDVRGGFGQGRVALAREAVQSGMADRVATLDQVIHEHLTQNAMASQAASGVAASIGAADVDIVPIVAAVQVIAAAVDNSAWDGDRAMAECNTATEYRSICAGEHTVGDPDERQHWALPHHYLGRGPNAAGVAAAQGRIGQTQDLANREAAQRHLDGHQTEIDAAKPDSSASADDELLRIRTELISLAE